MVSDFMVFFVWLCGLCLDMDVGGDMGEGYGWIGFVNCLFIRVLIWWDLKGFF